MYSTGKTIIYDLAKMSFPASAPEMHKHRRPAQDVMGGWGCKMASPFIRRGRDPRPRDSRREGPYLVPKPEAQLARWRQMISKPQNRTLAMQPTDRPSGVVRFPLLGSRPTTWLAFMATVASQTEQSTELTAGVGSGERRFGNGGDISIRPARRYDRVVAPLQTDAYTTNSTTILLIKCHLRGGGRDEVIETNR